MRRLTLVTCALMFISVCCGARAFTLTFDDVPAGQDFSSYYFSQYGISFEPMGISDHSESSWGPPHSGSNVLIGQDTGWNKFELKGPYWYATSVSAYFGTSQGAVIRMEMYRWGLFLTSVDIGAAGGSWSDRYVNVSPSVPFNTVVFRPISTPNALLYYSLDDLTIVPVPEPSSLLALAGGLAGMAGLVVRRRRGK